MCEITLCWGSRHYVVCSNVATLKEINSMTNKYEKWFNDLLEEYKDDPEFIQEEMDIVCDEFSWLARKLKKMLKKMKRYN